ncbi:uncharacterized protein LOC127843619 isoform X2 [Dreissena polymorpha]|uniref:uncharacterized protein LOC127843619 isoform X2 n=1 Tax=Dreissena polymorpha TaxID=45954 RepID=UPI0022640988|nr:uncharacterized protein LOC127843619 isoform X2 [Dreissena polymorpha]
MSESRSSTGAFTSAIEQAGNYFIMDTEQVISNPYQDLQSEAVDSAKKTTLTERLTAVRNNVCEHNLRTTTSHLDKQRTHSLRNLHMDTSNLRYQVKVMDINKRQNDLLMQQRITPKKDFSYDNRQIQSSSKRLGMSSEGSFYLEKKLKYPLRGTIKKDHNKKPIIQKARKTMVDHSKRKKVEHESERSHTSLTYERITSAHTVSTTVEILTPEPSLPKQHSNFQRVGSKSAPTPKIALTDQNGTTSRLSIIKDTNPKLIKEPAKSDHNRKGARSTKSHVKFDFKSKPVTNLHRSQTFHSGMPRVSRSYSECWNSDSDDDYDYREKVDLRALFFGDKSQNAETKPSLSGNTTPRTIPTRMSSDISTNPRCSTAKPKVTEEMLLKEQKEIKNKIDSFLGNIPKEDKTSPKPVQVEEKPKVEETKEKNQKEMLSKAAMLLSVFSKPIEHEKIWGYTPPKLTQEVKVETKVEQVVEKPKSADVTEENRQKKLWELIRTSVQNGNIKHKYTANDLLLQQLTGILVQADKKLLIPLHSASRALRHTPTFKMKRMVEQLMAERTSYQQQEIEKLQQANASIGNGDDKSDIKNEEI